MKTPATAASISEHDRDGIVMRVYVAIVGAIQ
jgi:hypothetical protein